ncbi:GAF domain-containing protein [Nocardia paucivorans]|uniref:GAF domain-containing protein n=1 Tax=Nocardia paucivorans TaxID=114259 RepID=UPI000593987D|nr:GAF domain-containing protein [Nocardia paucivorans]
MTVEALAPEGFSVVSVGDEARGFADWRRVLQRQLAKTPALYDGLTTRDLIEIIRTAIDRAEDVDSEIPTASGPHRLMIRPVFGPAGDVHAVQFWAGPETAQAPPRPAAVGAIWDLDSQTIQQPSGITRLSGIAPEEYVPRTSIAEFFHRITAFDRHAEVLDLLYSPEPGEKLQFEVSITHAAGRATQWRISMRARDDNRTRGAWWLIEDITSDNAPEIWPTLESVGLREAHRRAGNYIAVVQLAHTSISHWLTDPAPWIRWDYLFRPVDVFHPDDRIRLIELAERIRSGDTAGVTVRALNYNGGYTPTSLLLYPYPGFSTRELAIAQLVRAAEDTPVVEPDPVDLTPARTETPIGYDDQLRYRLSGRLRGSPVH